MPKKRKRALPPLSVTLDDGDVVLLDHAMVKAGFVACSVLVDRLRRRFVLGEVESLQDYRVMCGRDTDRHTFTYLRAILEAVWHRRGHPCSVRPLGELDAAEAELVLFATLCNRLCNRHETSVRYGLVSDSLVERLALTDRTMLNSVDEGVWLEELERLESSSEPFRQEMARSRRTFDNSCEARPVRNRAIVPAERGAFASFVALLLRTKRHPFTGRHMAPHLCDVEPLLRETDLPALVAALRRTKSTREACKLLERLKGIGEFLSMQVVFDLHQRQLGFFPAAGGIREAHEENRRRYVQFGNGSLKGARNHLAGSSKAKSQKIALRVARAIVEAWNGRVPGFERPPHELEVMEKALESLCPGGNLAIDLQFVEEHFCRTHKRKTPEKVLEQTEPRKKKPWLPNPCTSLEYAALYAAAPAASASSN